MTKLERANKYIKENIDSVTNRPKYHLTPEIGWMNDPNGFSFYKGKYHLFYQYYPYDTKWNNMHWGHASSEDLINWTYEKVALANDSISDANGCFSGSAIEAFGNLNLIYTGHVEPNMGFCYEPNEILQHQCLAYSEDGVDFKKYEENPIIDKKDLPVGYKKSDFRDPKVFEKNGIFYMVVASKNNLNRGEVLLYKSENLKKWEFVSSIYKTRTEDNLMIECPDLFSIDGKDVLIMSIMACEEKYIEEVGNYTEYIVGKLDLEKGQFVSQTKGEIDLGNSFYAPQTTESFDGKRIMAAWMKKWTNKTIIIPEEYNWNGLMTLPRELSLENNILIQKPISTAVNYFNKNQIKFNSFVLNKDFTITKLISTSAHIKIDIEPTEKDILTFSFFKNDIGSVDLIIDFEKRSISYSSSFDNITETKTNAFQYKNSMQFEFFIDLYSLEIFLNGGQTALTFTSFTKNKGKEFSIKSLKASIVKAFSSSNFGE